MDLINKISAAYHGNILLHLSYEGDFETDIPAELACILKASNGIEETMLHPKTGERISISWIIYPYALMLEENAFYKEGRGLDGFIFSDNGAGEPYLLKPDGTVVCYDPIDGEEIKEADRLSDFYREFQPE